MKSPLIVAVAILVCCTPTVGGEPTAPIRVTSQLNLQLIERLDDLADRQWSIRKANQWYAEQPWLVGCNFSPSTASNQLEMWQAETFDPETIDRELGYAASLGMNTVRTYLHDLVWQHDQDGLLARLEKFLQLADKHGIRPMIVFFDDCWNHYPKPGPQPDPEPGVHNSRWVQSPSEEVVLNPARWHRLESYLKGVLQKFEGDERILIWDLYNESSSSASRSSNDAVDRRYARNTWLGRAATRFLPICPCTRRTTLAATIGAW